MYTCNGKKCFLLKGFEWWTMRVWKYEFEKKNYSVMKCTRRIGSLRDLNEVLLFRRNFMVLRKSTQNTQKSILQWVKGRHGLKLCTAYLFAIIRRKYKNKKLGKLLLNFSLFLIYYSGNVKHCGKNLENFPKWKINYLPKVNVGGGGGMLSFELKKGSVLS